MDKRELLTISLALQLEPDVISPYCKTILSYVLTYAKMKTIPLVCILPDSFEEYFNNVCKKEARYEYRIAEKNNCRAKRVMDITPINDRIIEIWKSKNERQGRKINMSHHNIYNEYTDIKDKWVEQNYGKYSCPIHKLEFWVVEKDKKLVAYVEIMRCGKYALVSSAMGHGNYLKYGIMKYLFINIIRELIGRKMKFFSYGVEDFLSDEKRHFVKQLGITTIL